MQVVFTYPWYFVVLALLLSAALAGLLYVRNQKSKADFPPRLRWLLTILRFLSVFLILLLLLNPLIKQFQKTIIKPLVIFAQDNSESMTNGMDSIYLKNDYLKKLKKFKQTVSNKADLTLLSFGNQITEQDSFNFTDKATDFDRLFRYISQNYKNRNLAAVIVASDGLINHGKNPLYEDYGIKAPIHILAEGDTAFHKDIAVSDAEYNNIVLVDNPYPVKVKLRATLASGTETNLHIYDNGQQVGQQKIKITEKFFFVTLPFTLTAKTKGIHILRIVADQLPNENNLRNNELEIKINAIDARQKILIVANSPHPDIALLQKALKSNLNFDITTTTADKINPDLLKNYNLIILNQLPSHTHSITNIFEKIRQLKLPVFYIIGTQTDISKLNASQSFLQIDQQKNLWDDASPSLPERLDVFTLPDNFTDFLADVPPLKVPFGNYKPLSDATVVLKQKIKNIDTQKPLLLLFNDKENKAGFLLGENIWRWEIYDYKDFNTKDHIFQLINNVAQYLSLRVKKNNLTVNIKPIYSENEPIGITAEFYNEILEKTTVPDLQMKITGKKTNHTYTYDFLKTGNRYQLTINSLPTDNYQYHIEGKYQNKIYKKTGEFTVQESQLEQRQTRADFSFIDQLSEKWSGKFFFPNQWQALTNTILSQHNLVSISKSKEKLKNLIDWKLIFFIIIGFLTLEWFLRKYFGNY